jgi:hypothetical protein
MTSFRRRSQQAQVTGCAVAIRNPWGCQLQTLTSPEGEAIYKTGCGFNQILTDSWDFRRGRTAAVIPDGTTPGGRRYRCKEIGSYARAQELLRQGHTYLDSNGDGEACESLRH